MPFVKYFISGPSIARGRRGKGRLWTKDGHMSRQSCAEAGNKLPWKPACPEMRQTERISSRGDPLCLLHES
jgi:hypothetical protein